MPSKEAEKVEGNYGQQETKHMQRPKVKRGNGRFLENLGLKEPGDKIRGHSAKDLIKDASKNSGKISREY